MPETETPTPTLTLTPTETPTPTITPTPTPNYYIEVTTPAGEPARIGRAISVADLWIVLLLMALLVSLWLMYFVRRYRTSRKP